MAAKAVTLLELNRFVAGLVMTPATQNVWVTAELSDVAERGGHCYMELLQKNPQTGATEAKARAAIWANRYVQIREQFYRATGQRFATGLKVMVLASVSMHPVYGLSLVITAVDPSYTMGDLMRRRNEILARLKSDGILDLNRSLPVDGPLLRVAVISAEGAAGYGDFMNQMQANPCNLRFTIKLFPAVMQGERTPATVMAALEAVNVDIDNWDCVVIIRGGGATSDLIAFDDYDLAAHVAQFPLPVIVGIGHERDVTVLDYVAAVRVKTPTAAAEWLLGMGKRHLDALDALGRAIVTAVRERIAGSKEQLGLIEGRLPSLPPAVLDRARMRLDRYAMGLHNISSRHIQPRLVKLESTQSALALTLDGVLRRQGARLDAIRSMLEALSPEATLRRGYSITRRDGRAVTSASQLHPGDEVITTLAEGTVTSVVK